MILKEEKEVKMKKYNIYAGLGDAQLVAEAEEFENRAAAENYAYECALDGYMARKAAGKNFYNFPPNENMSSTLFEEAKIAVEN